MEVGMMAPVSQSWALHAVVPKIFAKNSGVQGYWKSFCPGTGCTTIGYGSSRDHRWTNSSLVNSLRGIEMTSPCESALFMAAEIDGDTAKGRDMLGSASMSASTSMISCSTSPGQNRETGAKSWAL